MNFTFFILQIEDIFFHARQYLVKLNVQLTIFVLMPRSVLFVIVNVIAAIRHFFCDGNITAHLILLHTEVLN